MRVLFIVPTKQYKRGYPLFLPTQDLPIGFAYLASALHSGGHEVFGLNPNNDTTYRSKYEMVYDKIRRSLRETQPELIGLGGLCIDFKFLKDAIQIIRKLAPDVPIVCGGGIINNDAEFIFNTLKPDFCISGESEETLVQLADTLESNGQDHEQIANLGYWKNGTAKFTQKNFNYIDINKISFPDYEPFGIKEMLDNYSMETQYYFRYTRPNPRPMSLITARGCPFNCTFCVHQRGARYRSRSVENIMQEIAYMYEQYHFNVLMIQDELFAVNKQRLTEFCVSLLDAREKQGWDFDWTFQTHASASLDHEALELAKKAGAYFFSYGLESASPQVLASMNKKTNPSQLIEAIEIANSVGIAFGGNFIFGDVAETEETICETMDFFSRYCLDAHINLGFIQPYPGSKLFENYMERGIIHDKLKFYEEIDERIWNITSMPDKLWLPWAHLMLFLARSWPWAKSTNASFCIQERDTADNPVISHSGKSIYEVGAKCPYCGKDVYYRELLGKAKEKKAPSFFVAFRQLVLRISEVFRDEWTKIVVKIFVKSAFLYLLSFRHPLFRLIKPVLPDRGGAPCFVTGCPHCNKRIRINIPIRGLASQLGILREKLFLKLIWILIK